MSVDGNDFDYIVVGSGSAGAIVATRLTENPQIKVLLLEAGPENRSLWSKIPLGFGKIIFDQRYTWRRQGQPEPGLNGRRLAMLHGKIVGGSSAINGMVYVRGFPTDYAQWRQMGAEGWAYDDVLPYFKKAERYHGGADDFHGADGPLGIERAGWQTPLADAFIASAQSIGIPRMDDAARAVHEGVGYKDFTMWRGRRSSTWQGYLAPNAGRPNLRLVTEAFVRKVDFDGRRAIGVTYEQGSEAVAARAGREVILCAGALQSPQLLQQSGVGPGGLLAELGIPVVQDLPGVGENLMDHFQTTRAFETRSKSTLNAVMMNPFAQALAGIEYVLRRRGPLTLGAGIAGGFVATQPGAEIPDVQIAMSPMLHDAASPGALQRRSAFLLASYALRPESRGSVKITSADPHAAPSIVFNALSTEYDRATSVNGLKLAGSIAAAAPLQRLGIAEVTPGLTKDSFDDKELLDHALRTCATSFHYSGTARMGTDDRAVVDPALRVRGLSGLRVIDASVMPTVVSGNTNAASIMIGEKGADLIKADW